jgi:hypothetical protein
MIPSMLFLQLSLFLIITLHITLFTAASIQRVLCIQLARMTCFPTHLPTSYHLLNLCITIICLIIRMGTCDVWRT